MNQLGDREWDAETVTHKPFTSQQFFNVNRTSWEVSLHLTQQTELHLYFCGFPRSLRNSDKGQGITRNTFSQSYKTFLSSNAHSRFGMPESSWIVFHVTSCNDGKWSFEQVISGIEHQQAYFQLGAI